MMNRSTRINRIKSLILWLMIGAAILCTACAGGSSSSKVEMPEAMKQALEVGTNLPDMITVTDADGDKGETALAAVTDMSADKFASYGVSYSSEGKADEIVVLNVKSDKDVSKAANSLTAHVANRQTLFENYDAKKAVRYDEAEVFTQGNCVVLIVCKDKDAVHEALVSVISAADAEGGSN